VNEGCTSGAGSPVLNFRENFRAKLMTYPEALAWLYSTQAHGIKLGLDRVDVFLADLGWKAGPIRFLHVAGTNGKGSVCAMLDSICRAAGIRTGLFTSPHLVTFRERIRLDGQMASRDQLAKELSRIREVCELLPSHPTFFEITTALALLIFQGEGIDIAILETGMGGRLDSTNIVNPAATAITSIGMDHMQYLGNTLGEIAREKAGIIKPGIPVVIGPLPAEAESVIAEVAAGQNAPVVHITAPLAGLEIALKGSHQRVNGAIAAAILEAAEISITKDQLAEGLRKIDWPGRFQIAGQFILDGAHNPDAAERLAETWREEYGSARTHVILGVVQDKDAAGICAALAPIAETFTIVPVKSPRAGSPQTLLDVAESHRPGFLAPSLAEAIASAPCPKLPTLITGSLFLIGEALVLLGLADDDQEVSAQ
jgi:dihydrofolate synthase/folylpolyglutamate synthase